jgi:hypothetical protein
MSMTTNAVRQARFRQRRRHALVVLRVEVQEDQTIDALVAAGLLQEHDADRRDRVELALSRYLAEVMK